MSAHEKDTPLPPSVAVTPDATAPVRIVEETLEKDRVATSHAEDEKDVVKDNKKAKVGLWNYVVSLKSL